MSAAPFHGPAVVRAAFVLAMAAWGLGFYGVPVYLHAVEDLRGWPVSAVSGAATAHFLAGAAAVTRLPAVHRRWGVARTTLAGGVLLGLGVALWALAAEPWQLYAAAVPSGVGWSWTSAAALNAVVSPWYVAGRPAALSAAFNGASVGGIVAAPLLTAGIAAFGFPTAAALAGGAAGLLIAALAVAVFARTPEELGQGPDGEPPAPSRTRAAPEAPSPTAAAGLARDRRFLTLAAGNALGLFAQVGLIAHLYPVLAGAFGDAVASAAMSAMVGCAIAGRAGSVRLLRRGADRRATAAASYGMQAAGAGLVLLSGGRDPVPLAVGLALFGGGIGNATSLPPLIAQADFPPAAVPRVVALATAAGQATYALAPALFGLARDWAEAAQAPALVPICTAAIGVQAAAALICLAGRAPGRRRHAGT